MTMASKFGKAIEILFVRSALSCPCPCAKVRPFRWASERVYIAEARS